MPADFTVIVRVRHQFGDQEIDRDEAHVDHEAPFVGLDGEFQFACPNVDSSAEAVLQFAHRGSMQYLQFPDPQGDENLEGISGEHTVKINGQELFGGIPASPKIENMPLWSTRLLIIQPNVLRETNVLRIESLRDSDYGNFDTFTIDNVVVFFKTQRPTQTGGKTPEQIQ